MSLMNNQGNHLKEALTIYEERMLSRLPSDEAIKNHPVFSQHFTRKMDNLIRRQKKPYYVLFNSAGKRVASIIITFILIFSIVFSVKALRDPIVNFFVEVYRTFSTVVFQGGDPAVVPMQIETYFEPLHIPEGYRQTARDVFDSLVQTEYRNEKGDILLFEQMTIRYMQINIDTEGTTTEKIDIHGQEGIFFSDELSSQVRHFV